MEYFWKIFEIKYFLFEKVLSENSLEKVWPKTQRSVKIKNSSDRSDRTDSNW